MENAYRISNCLLFPWCYSDYLVFTSPLFSVVFLSQYHSQNFVLWFSLPSFISWIFILYFFLSPLSRFSTFGLSSYRPLLNALVLIYKTSSTGLIFCFFLNNTFSYGAFYYAPIHISIDILHPFFLAYNGSQFILMMNQVWVVTLKI